MCVVSVVIERETIIIKNVSIRRRKVISFVLPVIMRINRSQYRTTYQSLNFCIYFESMLDDPIKVSTS